MEDSDILVSGSTRVSEFSQGMSSGCLQGAKSDGMGDGKVLLSPSLNVYYSRTVEEHRFDDERRFSWEKKTCTKESKAFLFLFVYICHPRIGLSRCELHQTVKDRRMLGVAFVASLSVTGPL